MKGCRILVLDDHEVARESLASWLKEDGHTVDTAASGEEAIALRHGRTTTTSASST